MTSATTPHSGTPSERAFFILLTLVFVGAYGLAVATTPLLRDPVRLSALTLALGLHLALHWAVFFDKLRPHLYSAYVVTQGLLAFMVAALGAHIALYFGVFMALLGESVGIFRGRPVAATIVAAYLFALGLAAYGLAFGWGELTWWVVSTLPMAVFVIIYVTLYSRQSEARDRAQALAAELEAANRQLSEYAARVEDLTIGAERQRIARELHDTLSQGLAGLILQLEAADAHLGQQRVDRARGIVADAMAQARVTLADARRAIDDLRRPVPDDLASALKAEVERFEAATAIPVESHIDPDLAAPEPVGEAAARLLTEALNNIARHARAHNVTVTAAVTGADLVIRIADDGVGFDAAAVSGSHYGLVGMQERARLVGGSLAVRSRPGAGTTLDATLPLEGV